MKKWLVRIGIILGGIVTRLPQNILNLIVGQQWLTLMVFVIITIITVFGIVIVQEGKLMIWSSTAAGPLGSVVVGCGRRVRCERTFRCG